MSERPPREVPYLHVRVPRRVVGVGGEGEPLAEVLGNRAGLLRLREQMGRPRDREPDRPDRCMFTWTGGIQKAAYPSNRVSRCMQRGCTSAPVGGLSGRPDGPLCAILHPDFGECAFHALR